MTRRPPNAQRPEREAHAALARVFGVRVVPADDQGRDATPPEPAREPAEARDAAARAYGLEA